MRVAAEGVYRRGRIELIHVPENMPENTRVIVTFLGSGAIDLQTREIDENAAAELRARLGRFAEDWESPEMDVYDDYDAAHAGCRRGDVVSVLYPNSEYRTKSKTIVISIT